MDRQLIGEALLEGLSQDLQRAVFVAGHQVHEGHDPVRVRPFRCQGHGPGQITLGFGVAAHSNQGRAQLIGVECHAWFQL